MFNYILAIRLILAIIIYLKVTITDIRTFKIPNYLLIVMAVLGITFNYIQYTFWTSTIIILISVVFFILFAYLSSLRFKGLQLFGAGDLKLIIATFIAVPFLNGFFTYIFILNVLIYTAIFSAIYSISIFYNCGFDFYEFGKKLYDLKHPYSLFLFLGFVVSIFLSFFI